MRSKGGELLWLKLGLLVFSVSEASMLLVCSVSCSLFSFLYPPDPSYCSSSPASVSRLSIRSREVSRVLSPLATPFPSYIVNTFSYPFFDPPLLPSAFTCPAKDHPLFTSSRPYPSRTPCPLDPYLVINGRTDPLLPAVPPTKRYYI